MTFHEDIGGNDDILSGNAFDRIPSSFDLWLEVFDNDSFEDRGHGLVSMKSNT